MDGGLKPCGIWTKLCGNVPLGLKFMYKNFGKDRMTSSYFYGPHKSENFHRGYTVSQCNHGENALTCDVQKTMKTSSDRSQNFTP